MYNSNLLPDYDAFTDSMEDDYAPETRTQQDLADETTAYGDARRVQIADSAADGNRVRVEEFTTGGVTQVHVISYSLKVGKLTWIILSDAEKEVYESAL